MAKNYRIALDAGHGVNTYRETGSKGVSGLAPEGEHGFNAAVVEYAKELAEACGIDVLLPQPLHGRDVSLINRTNLANREGVDLYLSFHADANKPHARGHWAFYWHTSSDAKRLADLWSDELSKATGTKHRGNHASKPGSWTNFHVCRETRMVAVLMEHAFMTNAEDLALLKSDAFRRQCAEAAVRACCRYFGIPFKGDAKVSVQSAPVKPKPAPFKLKDREDYQIQYDKGIGFAVVTTASINVYDDNGYVRKLKQGSERHVYGKEDDYFLIGAGERISANADYVHYFEHPKQAVYRVYVDGKLAGTYTKKDYALNRLEQLYGGMKERIEIKEGDE